MKRRIIIYGEVHNVGYRPLLLGIAESLGIERFYAENIVTEGEEAVEILIETDEERIDKFINLIKTKKPDKAHVKDVNIYDYNGYIMKIESYYRYLLQILDVPSTINYSNLW